MSYEQIKPDVVLAVEQAAFHRIHAKSDKELMQEFPTLSRSSIYRIMKAAKKKWRAEVKQTSHVSE